MQHTNISSVVRRQSNGATHAGRGGAGNVFKAGSADAEAAAAAAAGSGSAVVDDAHPTSSASSATARNSNDANTTSKKPQSPTQRPEPEKSLATKGKEWLLGKK